MKKISALLLALTMVFVWCFIPNVAISASAAEYSGSCGSLAVWSFDDETGTLTISGSGDMTEWSKVKDVPWYDFRDLITTVIIGDGITGIGSFAFYFFSALRNISIAPSVTSIGASAFYHCQQLADITLPDGIVHVGGYAFNNTAYYSDSSNWQNGLLYIGSCLLSASSSLAGDVTVKDGTRVVADSALFANTSVTSVSFPDSLVSIGDSAFYGCELLTELVLPDSVKSIGMYAFEDCTALTDLTIGIGITSLSDYIFAGCTSLQTVAVPDNIEVLGDGVFENCSSLRSVYIGKSVDYIQYTHFSGCDLLEKFTVSEENENYASDSSGILFNKDKTSIIVFPAGNGTQDYIVPQNVVSIADGAFLSCETLKTITFYETLKSVGDEAFRGCTGIVATNYYGSALQWQSVDVGTDNHLMTGVLVFEYGGDAPYIAGGSCGENLEWKCFADNRLEITGTGLMTDWEQTVDVPWYDYREKINSVYIGEGVESVDDNAFFKFDSLTFISVDPDNRYYVSDDSGVLYNKDKTLLILYPCMNENEEYAIADTTQVIADYAFKDATNIKSLSIPVTTFITNSYYTFSGCNNIENITMTKGTDGAMKDLGMSSTSDTVTYYAYTPWYICREKLKSITLQEGIVRIGAYAFYSSVSITDFVIPDTVTYIGAYAFNGCKKLERLTMPVSARIENNVNVFNGTTIIKTVTLTKGTGVMCNYSTNTNQTDATYYKYTPWYITKMLKEIVFESGIESIGRYALYECPISTLTLKDGVKTIESYAFYSCNKLTTVRLPKSIEKIGVYAFGYCNGITAVYYSGTYDDWIEVTIGSHNEKLTEKLMIESGGGAYIANGDCGDDIKWIIYDTGLLKIGGSGEMYGWSTYSEVPWYSKRTRITSISIDDNITSIGDRAFGFCDYVTDITLGKDIKKIGLQAFSTVQLDSFSYVGTIDDWCRVYLSDERANPVGLATNVTFGGQPMPNEIVIPENVAYIYDYAFYGFDSIKKVTMHDGVVSVGEYAFKGCTELLEVTFSKDLKSIGEYAFADCTALKKVDLTTKITSIKPYTFYNCKSIERLVLPQGLESVGYQSFSGCKSLAQLIVPESVKNIEYAFYGCNGLETVTLNPGIKSIAANAFGGCTAIKTTFYNGTYEEWQQISIGKGNEYLTGVVTFDADSDNAHYYPVAFGDDLFYRMYLNGNLTIYGTGRMEDFTNSTAAPWFEHQSKIKSVTVCEGVESIGGFAFYSYSNIEKVTIAGSVKSIGDSAFTFCFKLRELNLSKGTEIIGDAAFAYSSALSKAELPDGVKSIGDFAFNYSGIEEITIPDTVTSIGDLAFNQCDDIRSVTYGGTIGQWSRVQIGSKNTDLTEADIIYVGEALRVVGDANSDGILNLKDVVVIRRTLAGGYGDDISDINADVDADGKVTLADSVILTRYLAGGWDVKPV